VDLSFFELKSFDTFLSLNGLQRQTYMARTPEMKNDSSCY
jgi:hypothetical protein